MGWAGGGITWWLGGVIGFRARRPITLAAATAGAAGLALPGAAYVSVGFPVALVLLAVPAVGLVLGLASGWVIAPRPAAALHRHPGHDDLGRGPGQVRGGQGWPDPRHLLPEPTPCPGFQSLPENRGERWAEPVQRGLPPRAIGAFEGLASNLGGLIPVPALFFLASILVAGFLLRRTRFGRYVYAVGGKRGDGPPVGHPGGNESRSACTPWPDSCPDWPRCSTAPSTPRANPDAGEMKELDAIAAVVIGGHQPAGRTGAGSPAPLVGVLIFGYLSNFLNLKSVPSDLQFLLKGIIIVGAVLLQEGTLVRWLRRVRWLHRP